MNTRERCRLFLQMIGMIINVVIGAVITFASPLYDKEDYHTSALSGAAWVLELLEGHPNRIRCELGVSKHVFRYLISYLQLIGINHSQGITLEEQLAIFLYRCVTGMWPGPIINQHFYMCVTGVSVRHTGERFQWSNDTISKCVIHYYLNFDLQYIYDIIYQVFLENALHLFIQILLL